MTKENKTLLVAGASSDIGIELIKRVHANYSIVLAHYNRSDGEILRLRQEFGEKIVPVQANFMQEDATHAFVRSILDKGYAPDHYVHLPARPLNNIKFSKTTWETFEEELDTSLRSAVILSQGFLPHMARQKYGKIIFMLSFNVINQPPIKYAVPYTSAKYALLGLMRGLSAEYAEKRVMVNAISPSMIQTKFLSQVPSLIVEKNAAESPLKRNLFTEDVLPSFEFLLSDGADCVTGQNIGVTGGN